MALASRHRQVLFLSLLVAQFLFSCSFKQPSSQQGRSLITTGLSATKAPKPLRQDALNDAATKINKDSIVESVVKDLQGAGFQGRPLGAFEKYLAAERDDGSGAVAMPHVAAAEVVLAPGLSPARREAALRAALARAVRRHPLLRACIKGEGDYETLGPLLRVSADRDPPSWAPVAGLTDAEVVDAALRVEPVGAGPGALEAAWRGAFARELDSAAFPRSRGPLWRVTWLPGGPSPSSGAGWLVWAFNHGISDQLSANLLLNDVLAALDEELAGGGAAAAAAPGNGGGGGGGGAGNPLQWLQEAFDPAGAARSRQAAAAAAAEEEEGEEDGGGGGRQGRWAPLPVPPSIERTVGARGLGLGTARYGLAAVANGGRDMVLLPRAGPAAALAAQEGKKGLELPGAGSEMSTDNILHPNNRKTFVKFRELEPEAFTAFRARCKAEGVTVSAGLSAAVLVASAAAATAATEEGEGGGAGREGGGDATKYYKYLLAVDLRPFDARPGREGEGDWTGGTVASAGGAVDFAVPLRDSLVRAAAEGRGDAAGGLWDLARFCREETLKFIAAGGVRETVVMFDWGMGYVDIGEIMRAEAKNPKTLGRLFSCGLSNMGLYKHRTEYKNSRLSRIHYATSQTITGSLYQLSAGTINDRLCCTFQFTDPITAQDEADLLASRTMSIIEAMALPTPNASSTTQQ